MRRPLPFAVVLLIGCTLLGCMTDAEDEPLTFRDAGISFRYLPGWQVSGFSTTVSPPRLAVSSYRIPADAVEGDCGGLAAVELLPPEGVVVILIDYGEQARSFSPLPSPLTIENGEVAEYECFGTSSMFRFRVGRRDLQAHLGLGSKADEAARRDALSILTSIEVED